MAHGLHEPGASAIENSRLFEEQNRRAKIIEALAEIANVIATTREVGVALDEIAQALAQPSQGKPHRHYAYCRMTIKP